MPDIRKAGYGKGEIMDISYLETLPEVENKPGFPLQEGERLVFLSKLEMLGTEKGKLISAAGWDCFLALSNRNLLVHNGAGIWTVGLAEGLVSCEKIERRTLFFKPAYHFLARLRNEIVFDNGRQNLSGFEFYFEKKTDDMARFEEIVGHLFP